MAKKNISARRRGLIELLSISEAEVEDLMQGFPPHYLFFRISLDLIEKLLENNYLEVTYNKNGSPFVGEYIEFMRAHPNFGVHGRIRLYNNDDEDFVVFDGLSCRHGDYSARDEEDFRRFESGADKFLDPDEYGNLWSQWA